MKKILPPLVIVLLISFGILLTRINFSSLEFAHLSIRLIESGRLSFDVKNSSLLLLIIISVITLFKGNFTNRFSLSVWAIIGSILVRMITRDTVINIKSLSWLPEMRLSYLTVALASMIIILSLIIESRSINE